MTALVCAASQGLGRAAARALAAEGMKSICSRRRDKIEAAAADLQRDTHGDIAPFVADLSTPEWPDPPSVRPSSDSAASTCS